jgi:hypothetical protein
MPDAYGFAHVVAIVPMTSARMDVAVRQTHHQPKCGLGCMGTGCISLGGNFPRPFLQRGRRLSDSLLGPCPQLVEADMRAWKEYAAFVTGFG